MTLVDRTSLSPRPSSERQPLDYSVYTDRGAVYELVVHGSAGFPTEFESPLTKLTAIIRAAVEVSRPPAKVLSRLQEIAGLAGGWIEGASPISKRAISAAGMLFQHASIPESRVFPTEDGGVSLEWVSGDRHVSAEIDDTGNFHLHVLYLETMEDEETVVSSVEEAYLRLLQWLR